MTEIPAALRDRFVGWTTSVAWSYDDRITTWKLERDGVTHFLKVSNPTWFPTLRDERDRLVWARDHLPVPEVVDHARESDDLEWLLLESIPGRDGTHFTDDPDFLVPLLAGGMRMIHEVDPSTCPFDFTLDVALPHVRDRLERGVFGEGYGLHKEFQHLSFPDAVAWIEDHRPEDEDVVVCHNDYCVPNIIIDRTTDSGGIITGFVDLGEMALSDRWFDLAVASWSLDWNCGEGWQPLFFETYGIEPDHERITYYRLLYDLVS